MKWVTHWRYGGSGTGRASTLYDLTMKYQSDSELLAEMMMRRADVLLSYLGVYTGIVTLVILFAVYMTIVYAFGAMRASRTIHWKLTSSLLASTFRYVMLSLLRGVCVAYIYP